MVQKRLDEAGLVEAIASAESCFEQGMLETERPTSAHNGPSGSVWIRRPTGPRHRAAFSWCQFLDRQG